MARVYYLDILRLLATFAVILLHVSGIFMRENTISWYASHIYFYVSKWCVPVFLMISGSLFLQPTKQVSIKQLFAKYIFRLCYCLVVWQLLYSFVFNPFRPMLLDLIHRNPIEYHAYPLIPFNYHLWFLPMLIGVYILIPIFKVIVTNRQVMIYYLLLWFLFETYSFLRTIPILQNESLNYIIDSFHFGMAYGYSGYFLLGYYLSTINISKQLYHASLIGGLVLLGGTILYSFFYGSSDDNLTPNVILLSLSIFVCIRYLCDAWSQSLCPVLTYTRDDLFGIYLIHPFVLSLYLFYPCFKGPLSFFLIPIFSLIVFVISLYITKGLRSIPYIKKLC